MIERGGPPGGGGIGLPDGLVGGRTGAEPGGAARRVRAAPPERRRTARRCGGCRRRRCRGRRRRCGGAAAGAGAGAGAGGRGGGGAAAGAGAGAAGPGRPVRPGPGAVAAGATGAGAGAARGRRRLPVRPVPGRGRRGRGDAGLLGGGPAGDESGTGALDRGRRRGAVAGGRVLDRCRPASAGSAGSVGGRGLLGRGLLGGGLLGRGVRLVGLDRTAEALAVRLPAGAVRLRVLDGRRMALDAHPEGQAEVKGLLVGQAELMSELVYPDLLRQRLLLPFLRCRRCQSAHTTLHPRTSRHRSGRAVGPGPPACPTSARRRSSTAPVATGPRRARSKARRFCAESTQLTEPRHNQAPRPGSVRPGTSDPSSRRTTRTIVSAGPVRRHPMQVR